MPNMSGTAVVGSGAGSGAGIAGGTGGAATNDLGTWYIYRATSGAYYGVNQLSGASVYTHATDVKSVWDSIITALKLVSDNTTANTARAGGRIEFGPHIFNTTGPLVITNLRSMTVCGQGWLQQTIIAQNANFSAGHYIFEIGTATDAYILQGFDFSMMQIRGNRGSYTVGGGIAAYCSLSSFHELGIQSTNDTAFLLNGATPDAGTTVYTAFTNAVDRLHISGFGRSGAHTAEGIWFGQYTSDCDIYNCDVHQDTEAENLTTGNCGIRVTGGTSRLFNNHAYFCYANGYLIETSGHTSFIDCISESNGGDGMFINGPDSVKVIGGGYYSNAQRDTAANNIRMDNSDRFSIAALHMAKYRATTTNPSRNIQLNTCTYGRITDCTFADAVNDHIMIADGSVSDISQCEFRDGLTYSGGGAVAGTTPTQAISLYTSAANWKIHDNIVGGSTQTIVEQASGWTGNYNEIYNNKVGSGTITLQDGTTYTGRKWGNRNLTNTLLPDRIYGGQGAQVTATGDMTLGHGRLFEIAGNTTINGIRTAGWDFGSEIWLVFTGTPTITSAGAPGAGFGKFNIAGAFAGTNNDTLGFILRNDGFWYEIGRNVIA